MRCTKIEVAEPQALKRGAGDGGKRVRSAHNAKGVSDPQSSAEASTDHGSGLYAD